MKTTFKFQLLFGLLLSLLSFAQTEYNKLSECKSLTIQLFKGNKNAGDDLTKCLVSLAYQGGDLINEYNRFSENMANQSQEELQGQLDNLEVQRSQAQKMRQETQSAMINDVTQNIITQTQNISDANVNKPGQKSTITKCVNRPGYGCGQQ